jgi:uroporphyrinogen decarboxylase
VVPLKAAGIDVEIEPGVGPVVASPVRSAADLDRLRPLEPDDVGFVTEAVRALVTELGATPLIGFAGAPFTLASYLVEGGPSRHHERTKALMHSAPDVWHGLLSRVARITATFLQVQIDAGASVVQLFDSWAGALSEADYRRYVMPHSADVLEGVTAVPRIHFGVGTSEFLPLIAEAGADVVGVDWRLPLDEAARRVPGKALQGNLDPALLFADWTVIEAEVDRIIAEGRAASGHVFNLGHGVLPSTDPDVLARVVERVHAAG